jgi:hypothetical protein
VHQLEKKDRILIISFVTLLLFPLLYAFRHFDDNTLTSWRWVFADTGMVRVFGFIAFGIVAAFFLSKMAVPDRHPLPFLFCLSFLAVAPLWSAPEMILDTARYFLQAKQLEHYGIISFFRAWGRETGAWTDLPVVPFFYGLIFRYLGEIRLYLQIFTTTLFSLTVVLSYLIGRTLWDRETGLLAALFLPGIPYLLVQAPLVLVDVPFMFFLMLSLFTFLNALEKGGFLRMAAAAGAVTLTIFTKYSAAPMLLVLPVVTFVLAKRGEQSAVRRSAAVIATAAILTGVLFFAKYDVFMDQIRLLREYQLPGFGRWKERFVSTFFFQIHPLMTLAALFALPVAIKRRDIRFLVPAWFSVLMLALPAGRIRYMLPLFPLFSLMAAYGLNALHDREVKRFIAFCILAASLAVAWGAYLPFLDRTSMANLREAGRYLDGLPGDAVVVHVLPQQTSTGNTEMAIPLLDLYTQKRIIYRDHLARPRAEQRQRSPLRFSWDFPLPPWYGEAAENNTMPVVVISSEPSGSVGPNGLRLQTAFITDTGVFRYKTFLAVFGRNGLAETAQ